MTADVSSMVNSSSNSEIMITKDLLGGFSKVSNKDLELDLQVTKTWDVPVSLKSNNIVDDELGISCRLQGRYARRDATLVCTLDKVKSALQRAEKETMTTKKRSPPPPPPTPTPPPPPTPTPPTSDINRRRD
ncbi:INTEGRATOR COMPLEX SUBUNIT 6-like protein [Salix koriyanagi]|uniref:INTEGRATOR COMPLEX SUBUNIT 6-like protein n=1 Tax=Salix koriyanagi TaxID=2511006 RepID=A0A9Q0X054_9ROSI|nr:INTEGRATOR COMPLEX SUBUNIT 6-like protein [Salix koriyanagi]